MASVLALVDAKTFKPHAKAAAPGGVLPIDRFLTTDTSFATELSHGGAIYLVSSGPTNEVWLVAILEAPECAGIKIGDKRPAGWYAPINATPVTDISALRKRLKLGKDLEDALDEPRILEPAHERALRELLDAVDAPVIEQARVATAAPELDPKLTPIARAHAYLEASHVPAAIDAMVEAWRQTRAPVLADLVDRATRLLPDAERPMFDKRSLWRDRTAATSLWDQLLESDASALPQLLLHIPVVGDLDDIVKRLAKRPQDPRIGARLVELSSNAPFFTGSAYWGSRLDIWIKAKDVRTADDLLLIPDVTGAKADKFRAWAQSAIRPELVAPDLLFIPHIEEQLERLEEPLRTERALIDEIAQAGADDGPYLVYADWLIERGRPLGEFISLSCAEKRGALTPAQARRLAILVEVPYLAGAFDDLPASRIRKRDRGIDREITVSWSTTPRSWERFAAAPLARALTEIRLVGNPREGRDNRPYAIGKLIEALPRLARVSGLGKPAANTIASQIRRQAAVEGDDLVFGGPDVAKKPTRGGRRR